MARVNSPWAKFRSFFSVSVGFLATVLASASASAQDSLPGSLTNGLIAYYPFNGNAMDQSGNGHDGVVTAATLTTDRFGQNASAYSFNSPQASIDLGDLPAFEFSGDFTISFWLKGGAQQGTVYFLGKYTGYANVGYGIGTGLSNEPYAFLQTHGYPTGAYADGGNQLTDDQWHQLVAVYARSSALSVYVDGALAASTAAIVNVSEILANDDRLLLGQITSGQAFNGKLDDVRIYNRAINTDEISNLYIYEAPGGKSPPVITSAPQNLAAFAGSSATLEVDASSLSTMSYQWQFDGTNLPAATQSHLVINNVDATTVGTYGVTVCNAFGCAGTNFATLSLIDRPTNGLVVSIPFAGNGADVSGAGNNAEVFGATFTLDQFGITNSAIHFDDVNEQRAVVPYAPRLYTPYLTVCCWVRTAVNDRYAQIALKARYPDSAGEQWSLYYDVFRSHSLAFGIKRNSGGVVGQGWYFTVGSHPSVIDRHNQWQFVAATWDGTNGAVYVDGQLAGQNSDIPPGPIDDLPSGDIVLGRSTVADFSLSGDLDRFKLFDHALSPAEILAIFNDESPKLPPIVRTPPSSATVISGSLATFSVAADGTGPLSYQWTFGGTNIAGATNSQLTIPSVSRANAGTYSVNVCNLYGCTNSASATLTVNPGPVHVVLSSVAVKSPGTVTVPVALNGNGVENAVSFSLRFDPRLLSFSDASAGPGATNAQVLINASKASNGIVGFAIALPAGAALPEGTGELVDITFTSALLVSPTVTFLQFTDSPVQRSVVDANSITLQSIFSGGGTVSIAAADFEGDVSPRPTGDKNLTINDWVEVGRLVAGLDDIGGGTEFQRADCAPLATGGNGILSVTDWVQAGRFAVGLDPTVPLSGPTNAAEVTPGFNHPVVKSGSARSIQLVRGFDLVGGATEVSVSMDSDGNENAVGFSVDFDPTKLLLVSAKSGTNTTGATVNINTKHLVDGKIGVALALRTGSAFAAGHLDLVQMRFLSLSNGTDGLPLSFADSPVVREVASPSASTIEVHFQGLTLTNAARAFNLQTSTGAPNVLVFSWLAEIAGAVLEVSHFSPSGPWSNVNDTPVVSGGMNTVSISVNSAPEAVGYYRLRIQ